MKQAGKTHQQITSKMSGNTPRKKNPPAQYLCKKVQNMHKQLSVKQKKRNKKYFLLLING